MPPIPFEVPSAGAPIVIMPGEVNGHPARVVLDSGDSAPFTVLIGPAAAAAASVVPADDAVMTGVAVGAEGLTIRRGALRTFRLGDVRMTDVDAGITDAPDRVSQALGRPIDAIVGWTFLQSRTICVDYAARCVDLNATPGDPARAIRFDVTPRRRLPIVKVTVNGRGPFVFAVDTGAGGTLIAPEAAAQAGVVPGADGVALKGGGGAAAAVRGAVSSLGLAGVEHGDVRPVIVDFLPRISEAAGASLDGVIGADVLSRGRLTIDFPHAALWLETR